MPCGARIRGLKRREYRGETALTNAEATADREQFRARRTGRDSVARRKRARYRRLRVVLNARVFIHPDRVSGRALESPLWVVLSPRCPCGAWRPVHPRVALVATGIVTGRDINVIAGAVVAVAAAVGSTRRVSRSSSRQRASRSRAGSGARRRPLWRRRARRRERRAAFRLTRSPGRRRCHRHHAGRTGVTTWRFLLGSTGGGGCLHPAWPGVRTPADIRRVSSIADVVRPNWLRARACGVMSPAGGAGRPWTSVVALSDVAPSVAGMDLFGWFSVLRRLLPLTAATVFVVASFAAPTATSTLVMRVIDDRAECPTAVLERVLEPMLDPCVR